MSGDTNFGASNQLTCKVGMMRACSIELGTQGGVVNCAAGTQACDNGAWGSCIVGAGSKTYKVVAPAPNTAGLDTLALAGSAVNCKDNPCNPYCQTYDDAPEPEITTKPDVTVLSSTGGDLAGSNVPSAFKSKGSLNDRCTSPCVAKSCLEACQFDQHCGTLPSGGKGCVAFNKEEQGSCVGADITAPTTCVTTTGSRKVTVCNRGTVGVAPGVKCFVFSGGSPKYPEEAPSLRQATLVLTSATTLKPGGCETQEVPNSTFPNNGIESMMCNPPGTGTGGIIVETSAGTVFPSAAATTTWTNPERGFASDGSYAQATSTSTVTSDLPPTTYTSVSGWSSPSNAYLEDGSSTSVALPASGGVLGKAPTSNSTSGWSNPSYAYAAETPAALYASAAPAMPSLGAEQTTSARFASSSASNTCNNGSACTWQNVSNAYAAESPPALSPSWASANMSQFSVPDSNSIDFGGFNFADVPSTATITGLTLTVHWAGNNKIESAKVQAYKADGTPTTTFVSRIGTGSGNSFEETLTASQTYAAGSLSYADIAGSHFIRVTATHSNNSSSDLLYIDYVSVSVKYKVPNSPNAATLTLGNFGISVPSAGVISAVNTEVKWKVSAANPYVTLGVQPYTGTTALGTELTTTASSSLALGATQIQSLSNSTLSTLAPASLADGTFTVKLRATRTGEGSTLTNPDITESVDYVKVSVTYTMPDSGALATYAGFGFSIPSNALILGLTTQAKWGVSVANPNVTLGLQPFFGPSGGTELTTTSGTSPPTSLTWASATTNLNAAGTTLTASDLANGNFSLRARATRLQGSTGDVDTTALLDAVTARASYITLPTRTVDYSGFGLALPEGRDLMRATAQVKWRSSVANANAVLGFQAYKDGGLTPVGNETTTTVGSSPPTSDSVVSSDLDLSTLTPLDLNSSSFLVRVRATRGNNAASNPDFSALLDYVSLSSTYGTPTGGNVVECNPYNNWSATKVNPDPDPCIDNTIISTATFTVSRVFQANCAAGKRPEWNFFAYTSSTPGSSQISFRFRAFAPTNGQCIQLPAAIKDPPTALAVAKSSPVDTQVCSLDASTPGCPVNLYSGLGGLGAAGQACLQMDAYGVPSADGLNSPTLKDWTVRFSCLDNE